MISSTQAVQHPHNLVGGDLDRPDLSLVDISPKGPSKWLQGCFKLGRLWWCLHSSELRLVKEIREAILQSAAHGPNTSVAVNVQDFVLLVQNNHQKVILAAKRGEGKALLQWFLENLDQELQLLARKQAPP